LYESRDLSGTNREILPIDNDSIAMLVDYSDGRPAAANRPVSVATDDSSSGWICKAFPNAEREYEAYQPQ
jgi:hypothetical protein